MPPTVEDRLRDILEAIAEIEGSIQGVNIERFTSDRLLRLATERLLEIICEATRSIPDEVKNTAPNIRWRKMIDFGNVPGATSVFVTRCTASGMGAASVEVKAIRSMGGRLLMLEFVLSHFLP